ncbi:unnamed protein product [Kluyveromyces dobzhanskii CBS 2104]|uniref:WGS project CCBQ000000000 data, contig 00106 n=1 Tax=Kluyveromyces dobzhanskii CBS 2104 TaxID=1427455 RepID=A0A0A8L873_9SACH|nr:unnamed protein product [Kluyveromyces dobzhanskii CBS 2104]
MPALDLTGVDSFVPTDVNNPPFYIPLKNIDARYNVIQELGKGSFGSVTLAETLYDMNNSSSQISSMYPETLMDQTGIKHAEQENWYYKKKGIVAIKTMMNRLPTLHDYTRVREIKFILQIPAHKNLVTIYEMFIDDSLYHLHIVMECMEQNIYQLMKHRKRRVFSLPTLRSILFQILAGIKHIHDHDFFHRDIKPENILISPSHRYFSKKWLEEENYPDNYVVKVADYGLARYVNNRSPYTTYVSTRWYRSPEILLRKGFYSKPLDIWAYGCVVVELATFSPLFPGSDETDQIWRILDLLGSPDHSTNGKEHFGGYWLDSKPLYQALNYEFPYVEGKTIRDVLPNPQLEGLYDVVTSCLKWNPSERATASEIFDLPYFNEYVKREASAAKITSITVPNTNKEAVVLANKLGPTSSISNQWSRILSGLPHKSGPGATSNFNCPQKLTKVQNNIQMDAVSDSNQQQSKKGGVASWFKFSTQKNHANINPNVNDNDSSFLTSMNENINTGSEKMQNSGEGEHQPATYCEQMNDTHDLNDIIIHDMHAVKNKNIDNEVFTIELDDSMETVTGSQRISKELNDKLELYKDSGNPQNPPALELDDLDDEHDSIEIDDNENYRIQVLDEFETDENLAHEIKAIDEDENDERIESVLHHHAKREDENEDDNDDEDSLLNYYQDIMSKKQSLNRNKGGYVHSNGMKDPILSDQMALDDSLDLQEHIPRNLPERAVQQRVLDCLIDSSEHASQNLIQNSTSHNHTFQDGLSF